MIKNMYRKYLLYQMEHLDIIDFDEIGNWMYADESLLREFWDHILNFRKVFDFQQFGEDFLREIIERERQRWNSKWDIIIQTQQLSERFIEEYKDEWDWDKVFMYQHVSQKFIRKWKEKISDFVMDETDIGTYL